MTGAPVAALPAALVEGGSSGTAKLVEGGSSGTAEPRRQGFDQCFKIRL
jgi:hypothetical protein